MVLQLSTLLLVATSLVLAIDENQALQFEKWEGAGTYLFLPGQQSWIDATKTCRQYNARLAFPSTQVQALALRDIMLKYNVDQVHAAFHDQYREGQYYTVSGVLVNETGFPIWEFGTPVGGVSLNCGGFRQHGLVDIECDSLTPAICEENTSEFKDYDLIEGLGFYKLHPTMETWPDAVDICRRDGAHLLIINSRAEQQAIVNKYTDLPGGIYKEIMVGVHHLYQDRYFITIFGDLLEDTGYAQWAPNEPVADNNLYPILMIGKEGLYVQYKETPFPFVCEHSLEFE